MERLTKHFGSWVATILAWWSCAALGLAIVTVLLGRLDWPQTTFRKFRGCETGHVVRSLSRLPPSARPHAARPLAPDARRSDAPRTR